MKNYFRIPACAAGCAALVLSLSACVDIDTFSYAGSEEPSTRFQPGGLASKSVAVLPFQDCRGTRSPDRERAVEAFRHPTGTRGSFYLGLLPLFPYGYITKFEPENSKEFVSLGRFRFDPVQDLAAASAESLKAAALFRSVGRVNVASRAKTDYLWQGIVTNTDYRGRMFSYGVTYFAAPAFWFLGAPLGASINDLEVRFSLIERATGKVVWTGNYRESDYLVQWIYARLGDDTSLYPMLMKRAMNAALTDLDRAFPAKKQPAAR